MRPISAVSKEYILAAIEGRDDNGIVVPTSFSASMAFLGAEAVPTVSTTWYPADWVTVSQPHIPTVYKTKVLVGPSGGVVTLTAGSYSVWVKIVATFETPVIRAGELLVV